MCLMFLLWMILKECNTYCTLLKLHLDTKHDIFSLLIWINTCCSIVSAIWEAVNESISKSTFLKDFKMSELPKLHVRCAELLELLVSLVLDFISWFMIAN